MGVHPDGGAPRDGATALPANYQASFHKVNRARFVSQGHAAGRWEVDVWANDVAKAALEARSRAIPVGAVLVEEHYERAEGAARGPIMVMEKRTAGSASDHGDWRWAVVGAGGQLVADGVIEACAGCHDDAPLGGLFPIVD